MSRTEFRVPVDAPRPLGALFMVIIASATLAFTGRIPTAALGVHGLSLAAALLLRSRPQGIQSRLLPLLGSWLLILLACFPLWSEDRLIALASATMLTQGLQLLSARPRRTEFPLVGLALAQVVFAAVLSENLLFPILLLLFLFAGVWTLLVHTLQAEAFEAHNPMVARRVETRGLFQMAVLSTIITVFMATPIFFALPRTRVALPHAEGNSGGSAAGFSDRVALGSLGEIRADPRVQLRVRALGAPSPSPAQSYWKGMSFDHFDGWEWSVSPLPSASFFPRADDVSIVLEHFQASPGEELVRHEVLREAMHPGVVFTSGRVERIRGSITNLHRDFNGSIFASQTWDTRFTYTIQQVPAPRRTPLLQTDFSDLPAEPMSQRYLQLPDHSALNALIAERTAAITRGARSDAERAQRIESYLMEQGTYSNTPPAIDRSDPRSPIQTFLEGDLAAHCEYFATTMVLMARAAGLPARLVNGFAGGVENDLGAYLVLTGSDAHAWVEIHYASAGWVRYDPTPSDPRIRAATAPGIGGRITAGVDALQLWWFQRIVDFNRTAQFEAMQAATQSAMDLARWTLPRSTDPEGASGPQKRPVLRFGLTLLALALTAAIYYAVRSRRGRPAKGFTPEYAAALALLRRRELVPTPTNTARDFAVRMRAALPDQAAEAFALLTECYQAERYGDHKTSTAREELQKLRDTLRA